MMAQGHVRFSIRFLRNDPNIAHFVVEGTATGRQLGAGSYGAVEEVIMHAGGLRNSGSIFITIILYWIIEFRPNFGYGIYTGPPKLGRYYGSKLY